MPYADLPLVYLQKLEAPEHNVDTDNFILLNNTNILARKLRHTEQLIREAREMELHPILNQVGRFNLAVNSSRACTPQSKGGKRHSPSKG
jgi:hypothetical protein